MEPRRTALLAPWLALCLAGPPSCVLDASSHSPRIVCNLLTMPHLRPGSIGGAGGGGAAADVPGLPAPIAHQPVGGDPVAGPQLPAAVCGDERGAAGKSLCLRPRRHQHQVRQPCLQVPQNILDTPCQAPRDPLASVAITSLSSCRSAPCEHGRAAQQQRPCRQASILLWPANSVSRLQLAASGALGCCGGGASAPIWGRDGRASRQPAALGCERRPP